jgi:hypothetical protein
VLKIGTLEYTAGSQRVRDYVLDIIRGATGIFEWGKWAEREDIANSYMILKIMLRTSHKYFSNIKLFTTSSTNYRTVKRRFPRITARTLSTWSSFVDVEGRPGLGSSPTDIQPTLKSFNHS